MTLLPERVKLSNQCPFGPRSGSLVEFHDIFIVEFFPHPSLQIEVMIGVEDQTFLLLVIIVIRVLLVAICDEAIGAHLEKPEESSGLEGFRNGEVRGWRGGGKQSWEGMAIREGSCFQMER